MQTYYGRNSYKATTKKSFKLDFSRFVDTNLVKTPMKNAHKNSLILPLNSIVNVEVETPAKNKVLLKE